MNTFYLNRFEEKLQEDLLRLCTSYKMLNGVLLANDDIDTLWNVLAPEYMADAIPQIAKYPTVSVAWASYLGLAIAYGWDNNWEETQKDENSSRKRLCGELCKTRQYEIICIKRFIPLFKDYKN